MKNDFLRKMLSASRLTNRGKLVNASVVIQRALAGAGLLAPAPARRPAARRTPLRPAAAKAPGPAAGAARAANGERFSSSSFTGASGTRAFKLFVPQVPAGQALPLVVMLHGCTQNPDDFAAGTRMNELAEAQGVAVLYPEQAARSNAHRCWNWFTPEDQKRGAGEPALIAGMVRHVAATHAIDPERIYVAGLSAGGAMAAILAREYPDLFAAAGVHSGLPPRAAHDVASAFTAMKSGPVHRPAAAASASAPVIVFHGSADATVTPANGDAVIAAVLASHPEAVRSIAPAAGPARRGASRFVWRDPAAAGSPSLAEQWLVEGAPHAWSGGAAAGSYTDPSGPDASAEMLRFFLEHPRRA